MSELIEWLKKRRKRSTIIVPTTLSQMEEAKIAALYKEKERLLEKRILARTKNKLVYKRLNGNGTQKVEPSYGDEVIRQAIEETAFWGGLLGDGFKITPSDYTALMRLRTAVESLQAEYGADYPLVQTLARLLRNAKDNLAPRAIPREDVDVERVTLPAEITNPFSTLNVELGETEGKSAVKRGETGS